MLSSRADTFIDDYLDGMAAVLAAIDRAQLARLISRLREVRDQSGRVFCLGVGGSAAQAVHLVGDLRVLAGIEAYTPVDNVAELTAQANDHGWEHIFVDSLKASRCRERDAVLILSVGGGSVEHQLSINLANAAIYARNIGATVLGIVGRDGGVTAQVADECVLIPTLRGHLITAYAESMQSVLGHLIAFHPQLQVRHGMWEQQGRES